MYQFCSCYALASDMCFTDRCKFRWRNFIQMRRAFPYFLNFLLTDSFRFLMHMKCTFFQCHHEDTQCRDSHTGTRNTSDNNHSEDRYEPWIRTCTSLDFSFYASFDNYFANVGQSTTSWVRITGGSANDLWDYVTIINSNTMRYLLRLITSILHVLLSLDPETLVGCPQKK